MNVKALVVEFIGTFVLIFIGAGAGAISGSLVAIGLAHGLVVVGFAYAYGHISGLHINPAVTIGLLVGGEIKLNDALAYIVVQLLGGVAGAAVLAYTLGGTETGLGATSLAATTGPVQGFVIELLLTFVLVNVIYNTAVSGKAGNMAPVAIGLVLIACIMMGAPLTGAALNPARTLGPAVMLGSSYDWANIWIYFIGTSAGGALAGLLYVGLLKE